mmetsp:Transcript_184537/g.585190  ORF Transcript_184537/g.585190 Transcript_184537/m.585190 type:complete len:667 (+) Transcript_184537:79-2079(+)
MHPRLSESAMGHGSRLGNLSSRSSLWPRRTFARWSLLAAVVLSVELCNAAVDSDCITVEGRSRTYTESEVLALIKPWAEAGFQSGEDDPIVDVLQPISPLRQKETTSCLIPVLGYLIAEAIFAGGEDPMSPQVWQHVLGGIAWEDIARSPWPLFELIGRWTTLAAPLPPNQHLDFGAMCQDQSIWRDPEVVALGSLIAPQLSSMVVEMDERMHSAAREVLARVIDFHFDSADFCSAVAGLLALYLLVLLPNPLANPGYALRMTLVVLQRHGLDNAKDVVVRFGTVGWQLWQMLAKIAELERIYRPDYEHVDISTSADELGLADASDQADKLMEALLVTHNFLEAFGAPYIMVAGTLLGSVRHFGRIPWDDDVDLCVDSTRHLPFLELVAAQEALRMGLSADRGMSWEAQRALRYLQQQRYQMRIVSSRSLTFIVLPEAATGDAPHIDIWECWGLGDEHAEEIRWASLQFGVRIPRKAIFPRRKLPFGDLALWGPRTAQEATEAFFPGGAWRSTCVGRKEHSVSVVYEYDVRVPCRSFEDRHDFAGPWQPLEVGAAADGPRATSGSAVAAVERLLARRLPGVTLGNALSLEEASLSSSAPRLRLRFEATGIGLGGWQCEALLWQSEQLADHLLLLGASLEGDGPAVRSLLCGPPGQEASYVWEDTWL